MTAWTVRIGIWQLTPQEVCKQFSPLTHKQDCMCSDLDLNIILQLALDSKKRIFSWGFGGYGRLGHAEPKDELVPRLLKFFDGPNRGASHLQCGSSFSMALHEHGELLSVCVSQTWWAPISVCQQHGYNTIQLYCLCVEKFAFWLIIYIKTFNTVNNKTPVFVINMVSSYLCVTWTWWAVVCVWLQLPYGCLRTWWAPVCVCVMHMVSFCLCVSCTWWAPVSLCHEHVKLLSVYHEHGELLSVCVSWTWWALVYVCVSWTWWAVCHEHGELCFMNMMSSLSVCLSQAWWALVCVCHKHGELLSVCVS